MLSLGRLLDCDDAYTKYYLIYISFIFTEKHGEYKGTETVDNGEKSTLEEITVPGDTVVDTITQKKDKTKKKKVIMLLGCLWCVIYCICICPFYVLRNVNKPKSKRNWTQRRQYLINLLM